MASAAADSEWEHGSTRSGADQGAGGLLSEAGPRGHSSALVLQLARQAGGRPALGRPHSSLAAGRGMSGQPRRQPGPGQLQAQRNMAMRLGALGRGPRAHGGEEGRQYFSHTNPTRVPPILPRII